MNYARIPEPRSLSRAGPRRRVPEDNIKWSARVANVRLHKAQTTLGQQDADQAAHEDDAKTASLQLVIPVTLTKSRSTAAAAMGRGGQQTRPRKGPPLVVEKPRSWRTCP